jgi:hypothetical protein
MLGNLYLSLARWMKLLNKGSLVVMRCVSWKWPEYGEGTGIRVRSESGRRQLRWWVVARQRGMQGKNVEGWRRKEGHADKAGVKEIGSRLCLLYCVSHRGR